MKCRSSRLPAIEQAQSGLTDTALRSAFMDSEVLVLLCNGALVSQNDVRVAVDLRLPNVARFLLSRGGSFPETLHYIRESKRESFYCAFLYLPAVIVSYCKIPHLSSIPKLPKLQPLQPLQAPLRAKTLCIGGLLLRLLRAFAVHTQHWRRSQRSQLPDALLPVVRRCTGLAAVISVAGVRNVHQQFVRVDADFGMKCGFYAYSWKPERCNQTPFNDGPSNVENESERVSCLKRCAVM